MFQASRNWSGIQPLLDGMMNHLAQLPRLGRDRDARTNVNLVSEHGEVVKKYDVIFRELFCVAAASLSSRLRESFSTGGILYEEILPTGSGRLSLDESSSLNESLDSTIDPKDAAQVRVRDIEKEAERKKPGRATGSLMLLVKKAESDRAIEKLGAAGYRFADVDQVASYISASMQIKDPNFEHKLKRLANYTDSRNTLEPGPHVGFFGIRPRHSGPGYDVLVRKEAKNLLPSVPLPVGKLSSSHLEFLRRLDRMTVADIERKLPTWKDLAPNEATFARHLLGAIQDLYAWVGDKCIDDARLTAKTVRVPNFTQRDEGGTQQQHYSVMIALRAVIPAEARVVSANCVFTPLSFFKVRQLTAPGSTSNSAFTRAVHRELGPIINAAPRRTPDQEHHQSTMFSGKGLPGKLRRFGRNSPYGHRVDGDGNPIPTVFGQKAAPSVSNQSSSTLKLWGRRSVDQAHGSDPAYDKPPAQALSMLGGIMISQEVTVNVQNASAGNSSGSEDGNNDRASQSSYEGQRHGVGDAIELANLHGGKGMSSNIEAERFNELVTFVDELYALCVDR
jgi:hypothetical protein